MTRTRRIEGYNKELDRVIFSWSLYGVFIKGAVIPLQVSPSKTWANAVADEYRKDKDFNSHTKFTIIVKRVTLYRILARPKKK